MDAGGMGISFGSYYNPGCSYEEMLATAKEAARHGGRRLRAWERALLRTCMQSADHRVERVDQDAPRHADAESGYFEQSVVVAGHPESLAQRRWQRKRKRAYSARRISRAVNGPMIT